MGLITPTQPQQFNLAVDCVKYGIIKANDERLAQCYIFFDQLSKRYPEDLIYKVYSETAQKIINRRLDDKWAYFKVAFEKNLEKAMLSYVPATQLSEGNYLNQQILGIANMQVQTDSSAITETESYQVRFARSTTAEYFLTYANKGVFMPYPEEDYEMYKRITKESGERGRKAETVEFEEVSEEEFKAWESRMRQYGYGKHFDKLEQGG